ncbi:hypothetical protein pb186bvf_016208 [Paramecium bursaria]
MIEEIAITQQISWIPYPKKERILRYSTYLNKKYDHKYYIWNLSEYDYEKEYFNNQVANHQYEGYSSPPLYEVFLICKCILAWIKQGNYAIIHCQASRGRSVLLFSLLMSFINNWQFDCSINFVLKLMGQVLLMPTQQLYINYIKQVLSNEDTIKGKPIKLKSLIISTTPKEWKLFNPIIQVVYRGRIIKQLEGKFQKDEMCLFILDCDVDQDFIVRCKQLEDNILYPVFRIQLNTLFMNEGYTRLISDNIDSSVDGDYFVDLAYSYNLDNQDYLSKQGVGIISNLKNQLIILGKQNNIIKQ